MTSSSTSTSAAADPSWARRGTAAEQGGRHAQGLEGRAWLGTPGSIPADAVVVPLRGPCSRHMIFAPDGRDRPVETLVGMAVSRHLLARRCSPLADCMTGLSLVSAEALLRRLLRRAHNFDSYGLDLPLRQDTSLERRMSGWRTDSEEPDGSSLRSSRVMRWIWSARPAGRSPKERARLRQLEADNARPRMERDLLKRTVAFWVTETSTP
jgi:hypothetical protein